MGDQSQQLSISAEQIRGALLDLVTAYCSSEDLDLDIARAIGPGGYDLENCIMWIVRLMPRPDCAGACWGDHHTAGCYRAVWETAQITSSGMDLNQ
tara:strand:- start:50 stop:337 length:288 start_codon:yes stop_codon:yes gene_type:complete